MLQWSVCFQDVLFVSRRRASPRTREGEEEEEERGGERGSKSLDLLDLLESPLFLQNAAPSPTPNNSHTFGTS
jgi:hypothetical protein